MVFKESRPILDFTPFDPVVVDFEGASVDCFPKGLDSVGVEAGHFDRKRFRCITQPFDPDNGSDDHDCQFKRLPSIKRSCSRVLRFKQDISYS